MDTSHVSSWGKRGHLWWISLAPLLFLLDTTTTAPGSRSFPAAMGSNSCPLVYIYCIYIYRYMAYVLTLPHKSIFKGEKVSVCSPTHSKTSWPGHNYPAMLFNLNSGRFFGGKFSIVDFGSQRRTSNNQLRPLHRYRSILLVQEDLKVLVRCACKEIQNWKCDTSIINTCHMSDVYIETYELNNHLGIFRNCSINL